MAWNSTVSRKRVKADMSSLPSVKVEDLRDIYRDANIGLQVEQKSSFSKTVQASVVDIPRGRAIYADTVHMYLNISNFDQARTIYGLDTEASHKLGLSFLHKSYVAIDRLIDDTNLQRVDFHDTRVHLVVLSESGEEVGGSDVAIALKIGAAIQGIWRQVANEIYGASYTPISSCGIDAGRCLAINNGTKSESEPLFLGRPANEAAKLSSRNYEGIFLTDEAQALLYEEVKGTEKPLYQNFSDGAVISVMEKYADTPKSGFAAFYDQSTQINKRVQDAINQTNTLFESTTGMDGISNPNFVFFEQLPPLANLDYSELMPTRTLRQDMVTIFADICGYSQFIEDCIASNEAAKAVRALYIIRNELRAVLESDFGGRKLRFIGDCIEGLTCSATEKGINSRGSVKDGLSIASGMLSSLKICKEELGDIDELELSIGLELGTTPVSRIGIRGDRSVRVASSSATSSAEKLEEGAQAGTILVGINARAVLPEGAEDFIDEYSGVGSLVEYALLSKAFGDVTSEYEAPTPEVIIPRAHVSDNLEQPSPHRAHLGHILSEPY